MTSLFRLAPRKDPKRIEQLGRVRVDDYAWMKDDNWQQVLHDPSKVKAEVREHLVAENAYVAAVLGGSQALQDKMFEEMKGRIKEDDASVPDPDGPFEYFSRYELGASIRRHLPPAAWRGRRRGTPARRRGGRQGPRPTYAVGAAAHSPDHALYAWAEDVQGSEYYRIYVKGPRHRRDPCPA
ncbi:MAG: hypothetical protein WDM85_08210 [Caulobacteraceae bacterium]